MNAFIKLCLWNIMFILFWWKDHPQEKEMQKGKMIVLGTLQIAEKRREVKGKGEKERYTHLN